MQWTGGRCLYVYDCSGQSTQSTGNHVNDGTWHTICAAMRCLPCTRESHGGGISRIMQQREYDILQYCAITSYSIPSSC